MSCQGRCGQEYNSTNPCHCDEACGVYDNCCEDYIDTCASVGKLYFMKH